MNHSTNSEGYRDNTAATALYNLSQHHIRFSYGVMDINLSSFFPCYPHEAQALLKLVDCFCSPDDKALFLTFLRNKAQQMQERVVRLENLSDKGEYLRRELGELKRLYRRLMENISLFETMEVR